MHKPTCKILCINVCYNITVVHISYEKLISKLKVHVPHEYLHALIQPKINSLR